MRILRTIVFILVVIGLIWLVVVLFSKMLTPSPQKASTTPTSNLVSRANTDTVARFTMDGPVVANQDHRRVVISVDRSQSKIELVDGYNGTVIRQEVFPNNPESFAVFLRALDVSKYTQGNKSEELKDERGECPLQNRHIYELINAGTDNQRFWSTSCGTGTFKGNRSQVYMLFVRQIPQKPFAEITRGLSLR